MLRKRIAIILTINIIATILTRSAEKLTIGYYTNPTIVYLVKAEEVPLRTKLELLNSKIPLNSKISLTTRTYMDCAQLWSILNRDVVIQYGASARNGKFHETER